MTDEVFTVEIRFELLKALQDLEAAGRSSTTLTEVVAQLRKELQQLQQTGQAGGSALSKVFGGDLVSGTDKARAAIEVLKASFRGLAESGRTLDEIKLAFDQLAKSGSLTKDFGKEIGNNLRAAGGVAIKELRDEFKLLDIKMKESEQVSKTFAEVTRKGFGDPLITAQQFRAQVDLVKQQMIDLQRISKLSLDDIVRGFQQANTVTGQFSSGVIQTAAGELRNLGTAAEQTGKQMSVLDQISTVFFGTTLGNLALSAIRRVVSQFDELIQRGVEFSRTQFVLATSIRALQRIGLDITFAEVEEQVAKLGRTFSFFSNRQIREGLAQILLLTRNLKLTKDEMFKLSEATAALAIVTGKDFGEEGLLVARAIASGYTEALQRAGIEASRFRIQQEAMALGIDKAFLAMTQAERAAVTLRLVLDQVGNISDDVAVFQETLAGRLGEANARLENQADILGKKVTPVYVLFKEALANVAEGFLAWLGIAQVGFFSLFANMTGALISIGVAFESLTNGVALSMEEINEIGRQAASDLFQGWVDEFIVPTQNIFKDLEIGIPEPALDDAADELKEQADDLKKDAQDILRDFQNGLVEATIDFLREGQDIELNFDRDSADEVLEFLQDQEKINRETTDKIADKQEEFREKELKAERDFQEKLLRLREQFLFNLEDALRERDAKQVLRLIRQFNLQENQLHREFENERLERKEAFENEIEDIQEQRERKLRELRIEFDQRKAELELQRQREYEDRQIALAREMEDLKRRRDERLAVLKEGLSAELQLLVDYWAGVLSISTIGAVRLSEILRGIFGGSLGTGTTDFGGGSGGGQGGTGGLKFAEGGTLIARKPTVAVFGERDAEVVSFRPLNRIGRDENKVFNGFLPKGGESGSGRMLIELLLSPDLEARIVDSTLGQVGDVLVRTMS